MRTDGWSAAFGRGLCQRRAVSSGRWGGVGEERRSLPPTSMVDMLYGWLDPRVRYAD
jgi:hypothetical protein